MYFWVDALGAQGSLATGANEVVATFSNRFALHSFGRALWLVGCSSIAKIGMRDMWFAQIYVVVVDAVRASDRSLNTDGEQLTCNLPLERAYNWLDAGASAGFERRCRGIMLHNGIRRCVAYAKSSYDESCFWTGTCVVNHLTQSDNFSSQRCTLVPFSSRKAAIIVVCNCAA
jgi:hypothetical protein